MGAWGTGFFDDDTHCDFLENILRDNISAESFGTYFQNGIDSEYLEYDEGAEVIVAAALLDNLLNGTELDSVSEELPGWLEANRGKSLDGLKPLAVQALKKLVAEDSELNELWSENEEDYPEWKGHITGLIERLN
ncbi:MAG: hypothetical protein FD123_2510 [Bacteroidetes bacterium]|nr:MAG: hypothetical protein FD123_2510 [Bacteroidota bacterium]